MQAHSSSLIKLGLRLSPPIAIAVAMCSVAALSLFTGCSTTDSASPSGGLAGIAVQYATIKVVGDDSERAARVVEIVGQARATIDGEASVTVAALMAGARSAIRWERLDPADTLLVNALLGEVEHRLAERLGDGLLDPERRLRVGQILGWVETAARAAL